MPTGNFIKYFVVFALAFFFQLWSEHFWVTLGCPLLATRDDKTKTVGCSWVGCLPRKIPRDPSGIPRQLLGKSQGIPREFQCQNAFRKLVGSLGNSLGVLQEFP